MQRARIWSAMGLLALGLTAIVGPAESRAQEKSVPMVTFDKSGAMIVSIGGQSRFQMKSKKRIKEAFNENNRVITVLPDANDPTSLILIGVAAGTSKLELTDADGGKESYLIIVQRDMELLRNLIRKTVPTASIEVTPIGENGNSIILSGFTVREDDRDTVRQLAEALGLRVAVSNVSVGGGGNVPHVQLDLTLARVDRSKARSRGANWIINGNTVSGGSILGGLLVPGAGAAAAPAAAAAAGLLGPSPTPAALGLGAIPTSLTAAPGTAANIILGVAPWNLQAVISCLKSEGLAKLVAAPTTVARSGEQAYLQVGSRVPVISGTSGITGPGVTYERIGTELQVLPVVYGNGKISLTIRTSVSSVSGQQALVTTFGTSPAFDNQEMTTSIVIEPGQTAALGGLIQTTLSGTVSKIPLLGDMPYIGKLFSFATQTENETELVVLVTPHLIDPADSSQMPRPLPGSESRRPDDFEFYLETMLEAPRGKRQVWDGHHYRPAWQSSPTAGTYPCVGGPAVGGPAVGGPVGVISTGPSAPPVSLPETSRRPREIPPLGDSPLSARPRDIAPLMSEPLPTPPASLVAPLPVSGSR